MESLGVVVALLILGLGTSTEPQYLERTVTETSETHYDQVISTDNALQAGQTTTAVPAGAATTSRSTPAATVTPSSEFRCIDYHACAQTCGAHGVDYSRVCQCDDLCRFYGDCCSDYYARCLRVDISDDEVSFLTAVLAKVDKYSQLLDFYNAVRWSSLSSCAPSENLNVQLIDKCGVDHTLQVRFEGLHEKLNQPSPGGVDLFRGISKSDIAARCQERNKTSDTSETILDRIPVTLINASVHFHNVFCAICNGIGPNEVTQWKASVNCPGGGSNDSTAIPFNYIGKVSDNCSVLLDIPFNTRRCILSNDPLADDSVKMTGGYDVGDQITFPQTTCQDDSVQRAGGGREHDKASKCKKETHELSDLCRKYQYPVFYKGFLFKNKFCLTKKLMPIDQKRELKDNLRNVSSCSYQDCSCAFQLQNYDGKITWSPQSVIQAVSASFNYGIHYQTPNFRNLFDFNSHTTWISVHEQVVSTDTRSCPASQVYVPLYQECVALSCATGTTLRDGDCVREDLYADCQGKGDHSCYEKMSRRLDESSLPYSDPLLWVRLLLVFDYILDDYTETRDEFTKAGHDKFQDGSKCSKVLKEANVGADKIYVTGKTQSSQNSGVGGGGAYANNTEESSMATGKETANTICPADVKDISQDSILNVLTLDFMTSVWARGAMHGGTPRQDSQQLFAKVQDVLQNTTQTNVSQFAVTEIERCGAGGEAVPDNVTCFTVTFHYAEVDLFHVLLALIESEIVPALTDSAHDHNFKLTNFTLTNEASYDDAGSMLAFQQAEAANTSWNCSNGGTLQFVTVGVAKDANGTYAVQLNSSTKYKLNQFVFFLSENNTDGEFKALRAGDASIGWCAPKPTAQGCTSNLRMHFNTTDFIEYRQYLITTDLLYNLTLFLNSSVEADQANVTVRELVNNFKTRHEFSFVDVYDPGSYLLTETGAEVCPKFVAEYNVTKKIDSWRLEARRFLPTSDVETVATLVALCVSITCLVVVLVVYSLVPELRNIPGQIVMSMSSALLLAQVLFLCCSYPQGLACEVYASVHHAAWLASFAWLAAMSFHLTYILHSKPSDSLNSDTTVFLYISLLCWGLPCLLAIASFTLDKTGTLAVDYGKSGPCWIGNYNAMLYLFGVPLFLLLTLTAACACFVIRAIRESSKFRNRNSRRTKGERSQLLLCINLSLLMGVNWVFYFVAVAWDNSVTWAVFILTNGSQGLFLALCYVMKRSVMLKVARRFGLSSSGKSETRHDGVSMNSSRTNISVTLSSSPQISHKFHT